ncbi:YTH domain-containing protein 1-like isoform X2 [Saccostrea cucullata]|uniref:YTH domain-containing protein 1-like isoform X2 n=1 Tax=Saccostrea cuccullata TaxID=36930 RepID=UPI002ED1AE5E
MEAREDNLNINLGSKRKASIDEETEVKRKIPRTSAQTSDENNELGLNARNGSAETDLSRTENIIQNSNQSYALNLRRITNESIRFEFTTETTEDDDNLAENDLSRYDEESQERCILYSRIPIESKTESNKDEGSKQITENKEQIEKTHKAATSREGQASFKVEDRKLEVINAAEENSLEERVDKTRVSTVVGEEKENKQDDFGINPDVSSENDSDDSEISDVDEDKVAVEQTSDEYVYRILRFDETYHNGLRPKKISSRISLQQHVERGSKGQKSRFISCCKTLTGIRRLGSLTNEKHRRRDVVKINITKLTCSNRAEVIDLTREDIRARHISRSSDAWEYSEKFEEVIIVPTLHVPSECVEKIGVIHRRSFSLI